MASVMLTIRSSMELIISLVRPSWRCSPLTVSWMVRSDARSRSRSVSTQGPSGQEVSKPLARAHCFSRFWTSRAVMSLAQVKPKITSLTRSRGTSRHMRPMTTANSASWWRSSVKDGYWISSPGPITAVEGLKKANGASGTSWPSSRACSA